MAYGAGFRKPNFHIWDFMYELDLSHNELFVYALIYSYSRDNKYYWGGKEWLGEALKISSRTVYRTLDALIKKGYVELVSDEKNRVGLRCVSAYCKGRERGTGSNVTEELDEDCHTVREYNGGDYSLLECRGDEEYCQTECEGEAENIILPECESAEETTKTIGKVEEEMYSEYDNVINKLQNQLEELDRRANSSGILDTGEAIRREYAEIRREKDRESSFWEDYVCSDAFARALERSYGSSIKKQAEEKSEEIPHASADCNLQKGIEAPQNNNLSTESGTKSPLNNDIAAQSGALSPQSVNSSTKGTESIPQAQNSELKIGEKSPQFKNSVSEIKGTTEIPNANLQNIAASSPPRAENEGKSAKSSENIKSGSRQGTARAENSQSKIRRVGKSIHGDDEDDESIPKPKYDMRLFGNNNMVIMTDEQYINLCSLIDEIYLNGYVCKLERMLIENRKCGMPGPHSHYRTIKKWIQEDTAL